MSKYLKTHGETNDDQQKDFEIIDDKRINKPKSDVIKFDQIFNQ